MANEIIKPHKFEDAKNKIHSLSKTVPNVSLQNFQTEGSIFSCNNHNITGKEVNELLVSPLQSTLIEQNKTIKSLFKIADEVYKALESLDKEYIQGIIAAVMSAKEASEQAKEASRKAFDASTKATTAQADIKRTIEALQTTVRILKEFKEKTTKDLSSIASLHSEVTSVNSKIRSIEKEINDFAASTKEIQDIQSFLSSLTHIKDIDQIWTDLTSSREVVKELIDTLTPFMHEVNQSTSRIDTDVEALKQYRTMLETYQHLGDVDAMWNDVEEHKTNLEDFHKQVDDFIRDIRSEHKKIYDLIHQMKDHNNIARQQYNKKIKIAYWVGGSTAGLIVINYILQIIGVL
ncbi:hypothetical protein [Prevotella pallens]|uniref:hypothetical protein n=1 Tax=Prevotella pallens TaxID=60133 RepID=UPI0028DC37C1|nr:hypothetical protein [Prevotella pallens]